MRFNPFAATGKGNFDRYLLYRGLGYSVPAAEVLSRLTYGDRESVLYAKQFPIENRLQMMYACMTERSLSVRVMYLRISLLNVRSQM